MSSQVAKSFCRNCSALCSMEVTIEDGRLVTAAGDGSVSPSGGYMCVKGLASVDFHNGAEGRLQNSLKRDPSGRHIPIDNARELDEIASQLEALIATHGPRSVAV